MHRVALCPLSDFCVFMHNIILCYFLLFMLVNGAAILPPHKKHHQYTGSFHFFGVDFNHGSSHGCQTLEFTVIGHENELTHM